MPLTFAVIGTEAVGTAELLERPATNHQHYSACLEPHH